MALPVNLSIGGPRWSANRGRHTLHLKVPSSLAPRLTMYSMTASGCCSKRSWKSSPPCMQCMLRAFAGHMWHDRITHRQARCCGHDRQQVWRQRAEHPTCLTGSRGGGGGWTHVSVTETCFQMSRNVGSSIGGIVQKRLLRHGCRCCRATPGRLADVSAALIHYHNICHFLVLDLPCTGIRV